MIVDPFQRAIDRDWLRARLSHEAVMSDMWPILVATWERLPAEDRAALRFRFDVVDVPKMSGAAAGIPPGSEQIRISLGDNLPVPLSVVFVHECAHVFLGHIDRHREHPPRPRVLVDEVSPKMLAVLQAAGWQKLEYNPKEDLDEIAAWEQVEKWGFTVPDEFRQAKAGGPA